MYFTRIDDRRIYLFIYLFFIYTYNNKKIFVIMAKKFNQVETFHNYMYYLI